MIRYPRNKYSYVIPVAILLFGLITYGLTAFPTITWWDTSEYATAAVSLGITGAPGSLLLTVLGWLCVKIIPFNSAHVLNVLASLIGASSIMAAFLLFQRILRFYQKEEFRFDILEGLGFVLTSFIPIFSYSLWNYSTMFNPYILTTLFTMLILAAVFLWWQNPADEKAWKNIFLITLLLGVDFSVHRTNSVLVPGIIVLMLIRDFRFLLKIKSYLAAISGLILGLSLQLLYIPLSLRDPLMNMGETNDFQSWWNFISLKQHGGNFLLDIITRKGPFWTYQVPYFFHRFSDQFFFFDKTTIVFGYLPTFFGILGLIYFFKLNRKLGWALSSFYVITIIVSIVYFNLPENYFRTIYRHFLPTYIIFAVFIFAGVKFAILLIKRLTSKNRVFLHLVLYLAIILTAYSQFNRNIFQRNNSRNYFTLNHAKNVLGQLDENAILFSNGDNNLWPMLYVSFGEDFRTDITQCNLSLSNLEWYVDQHRRHDPEFPFSANEVDLKTMFYPEWKADTSNIFLDQETMELYNCDADSIQLILPPLRAQNSVMLQDIVLYSVIKNNAWKRPIYFIKQGLDDVLKNWLQLYLQDQGLVYKLVPDSSIFLDDVTSRAGQSYYAPFINVIQEKVDRNDQQKARKYFELMVLKLPLDRLNPDEKTSGEIKQLEREIY